MRQKERRSSRYASSSDSDYHCEQLLGQDHDLLATIVAAAEDTVLVVQGEQDIVAEVILVHTLAVGQDHHDDHIHIHEAHRLTIGDDRQFCYLNNAT